MDILVEDGDSLSSNAIVSMDLLKSKLGSR